jgi:hypothetical protein
VAMRPGLAMAQEVAEKRPVTFAAGKDRRHPAFQRKVQEPSFFSFIHLMNSASPLSTSR